MSVPFHRQAADLMRLAQPPVWAAPAIISLSIAGALLEALGLVLFIPLLQSLGASPAQPSFIERLVGMPFSAIAPGYATTLIVALLCASIVLKNLVALTGAWVTKQVDGLVAHRVRVRIFEQTLSSCIDFRPGVRRADLATIMTTESWNVSRALGIVHGFVVSLITGTVFVAVMVAISPPLTLLAIGVLGAAGTVVRLATRRADATGRAVIAENRQFGLRMWESIQALQVIRAFAREDYEAARFRDASNVLRGRMLRLELLWSIPGPVAEISVICLIGLLILVAHKIGVGIAALAAFLSLLYRMQGPIRDLLGAPVTLDSLAGSIGGVADLLRATATPHLRDGTSPAPDLVAGIALRGVSFRYGPDEPWALRDVTFNIPAGNTTAIVGESGAGKSTLMALLFRFQDPTIGQILVNETPLSRLSLAGWRARLALMSQEVQLFNDSVSANIAYGRIGASDDDVRRAAATARAHEFIMALPQGYDTIVGDQGLRLSGGQRQRIALARTVLRDADVLLLDEATNALDAESEAAFQLALDEYSRCRTVVVIAHRLSTVRNADQVVVLGNGRVIEAGAPSRLLDEDGHFARLYNLQQGSALVTG